MFLYDSVSTSPPHSPAQHARGIVVFLFCVFSLSSFAQDSAIPSTALSRYLNILNRAPFGATPPPPPSPAELAQLAALTNAPPPVAAESLAKQFRLTALTSFQGTPAAGFIHLPSNRSFLLLQGQSLAGYTLESVNFRTSTARLSTDGLAEDIPLQFASGQPTNTVQYPTHTLPPLEESVPTTQPTAPTPMAAMPAPAPPVAPPALASGLTAEEQSAATQVDPVSGESRISFRELHRIRLQQKREKAEAERLQREAEQQSRELAEKQKAAAAELFRSLEEQQQKQHRAEVIEAIKEGRDVHLDFELTPSEAKALAEAGFAIPEEVLEDSGEANGSRASREARESNESREPSEPSTPREAPVFEDAADSEDEIPIPILP